MTEARRDRFWPFLKQLIFIGCLGLIGTAQSGAAEREPDFYIPPRPSISLIIDDLGNTLNAGLRAVSLPGPIAYAFLPHTPHAVELAKLAHSFNKEILLHAPMEAEVIDHNPGPGALTLDMTEQHFIQTLQEDLAAIPHVIGINNHMGSLLTRHPGHMLWLMRELDRRGNLFFVDSMTTEKSIALQVAAEQNIPSLRRDVFLDNERSVDEISAQFQKLVRLAKQRGHALGIGHPYPETLAALERLLPQLEELGVNLVPVTDMIKLQRQPQWQASLSHSPKAARNSKPSPSSTCCAAPDILW
ncbi:MAG: divergent polysaccharide deacetylase family protein [Pseudomonadota bacterium]